MPIDYRQLIADRKSKQTRPIVRHAVCLAPDLYADLEEAREDLDALELAEIDDERGGGKVPSPALASAREVVAKAEARIAEVTVTAVFKAPTSARQGQQSDDLLRRLAAAEDKANEITVDNAKACLLEGFDHFEGPGRERLDLNKTDLEELLEQMSQAEIMGAHRKLSKASTVDADLPFSVRQSLGARHSAETSS